MSKVQAMLIIKGLSIFLDHYGSSLPVNITISAANIIEHLTATYRLDRKYCVKAQRHLEQLQVMV